MLTGRTKRPDRGGRRKGASPRNATATEVSVRLDDAAIRVRLTSDERTKLGALAADLGKELRDWLVELARAEEAEKGQRAELLAQRAGVTLAGWIRDLGRRALAAAAPPPEVVAQQVVAWPRPFTRFAAEVLHLTLTRAQRVFARVVFDGVDPCALEPEERELAREIFGGVQVFDADARAGISTHRLGRGSGKSTLVAAFGVFLMLTADLTACGPGDRAAVCVVSPRGRTSAICVRMGREFAEVDAIRPMLESSNRTGFVLHRPDGHRVEFCVIPKSRGGNALRGFSIIALVGDEFEFVPAGGKDSVVDDADIVEAAVPRLLEGGFVGLISTPWPAPSEMARLWDENFGHPVTGIASRASTLLMRDGDPSTAVKIARSRRRNPQKAALEFDCILAQGAAGQFFQPQLVKAALEGAPIVPKKDRVSAGFDPAFVSDGCALAVVERQGARLVVLHLEVEDPEPDRPIVPSDVLGRYCDTVRGFGCYLISTDMHKLPLVREVAAAHGLQTFQGPKVEGTLAYLREVLREGRLQLPPGELGARLVADMGKVTFRPRTHGAGLQLAIPRDQAGHGDLLAALAQAVWMDQIRFGPIVQLAKGFTPRAPADVASSPAPAAGSVAQLERPKVQRAVSGHPALARLGGAPQQASPASSTRAGPKFYRGHGAGW